MSYCQFGWGGSSAYIFGTNLGNENVIECCGCILEDKSLFFKNYGDLLRHIDKHRAAGYFIPTHVDALIEVEVSETPPWMPVGTLPHQQDRPTNPAQPISPPVIAEIEELMRSIDPE